MCLLEGWDSILSSPASPGSLAQPVKPKVDLNLDPQPRHLPPLMVEDIDKLATEL